ncbi:hypothetical protein [Longimicrobium sp.]|uniref:hypothetical protein n=1 Tax=Longimicrobium sp. TaxID=2029185 RepID=UPI002BA862F5|nr:hypothetical protein [Longimicrobium sp.]HSU13381.1 hypothetical protein [Longimicrobium sp.]
MERSRFIEHGGKRILVLDYTGLGKDMDQLRGEIEKSKARISAEQPGTVLTMTDVRGAHITPGGVKAMQELVKHNAPFVKWSAIVVGLTGVYLTAFRATQALSRRKNMKAFTSHAEAQEWLVSQP